MLALYEDIRSRIQETPVWHDSNGVPRYGAFHPDLCPNIYADEVLLYEIACQSCERRYLVEDNWSRHDLDPSLAERVLEKRIHYGDPPCWVCSAGATMSCIDIRTVEFWRRSRCTGWQRVPKLEGIVLDETKE